MSNQYEEFIREEFDEEQPLQSEVHGGGFAYLDPITSETLSRYERLLMNPSDDNPNARETFTTERDAIMHTLLDNSNERPFPLLAMMTGNLNENENERAMFFWHAILTGHLYKNHSRLNVPIHGWFKDAIDNLNSACLSISRYFTTIQKSSQNSEVSDFMDSLKRDFEEYLISTTHLATILAMHAQTTDSGVFMCKTKHSVNGRRDTEPRRALANLFDTYNTYGSPERSAYTYDKHAYMEACTKKNIYIPTIISTIDIHEFSELLKIFWERMENSLSPSARDRCGNKYIDAVCRPQPTRDGEARMGFTVKGSDFDGFNFRVDSSKGRLAIDCGRVAWRQAMAYAASIGEQESELDLGKGYRQVLGDGNHSNLKDPLEEFPRGNPTPYPTVMRSDTLDINEAAALVAAIAINRTKKMGLKGDLFGYHHYGSHIDTKKNQAIFPDAVRAIGRCIPGAKTR